MVLLLGALERNSYAQIKGGLLVARFGFTSVATLLSNIERWEISGPYSALRAIGIRGTPGHGDITFGGSTHGGIALFFRRRVPLMLIRRLRVLYLTLDDLEGFAAELSRRGIPGRDVRRSAVATDPQ